MLKAVIFDMDGVLVDSEPLHYEADKILLKENLGIELDYTYYKQYIGSTVTYMWGKIVKDFKIEKYSPIELRKMADEITKRLTEEKGLPEIEGVADFVKGLEKKYKLAVASSSKLSSIEENVKNLGIYKSFNILVSGEEVKNPKPDPEIFLRTAGLLEVKPQECIVVEDSANGVRAAKAAGMACAGFINPNSGEQDLSKADYLFESFKSIDYRFLEMVYARCFDEPFAVLETDRLYIREMAVDDCEDKATAELISQAFKLENTTEILKKYVNDYRKNVYNFFGFGMWLLISKERGNAIGIAGVEKNGEGDFELGYYIGEKYRRNGYGYEASSVILKYVTEEFGISEIGVTIEENNEVSKKLARKLGL